MTYFMILEKEETQNNIRPDFFWLHLTNYKVWNFYKKMYTMNWFKTQTATCHQLFAIHTADQLWITEN